MNGTLRSTAVAVALALAACGGDDGADPGDVAPGGEVMVAGPAGFPVTIDHKYGSTTIESAPERVVVVGLTEQDALLALGVVPVGTTEWFGDYPGAIWPWAQPYLDGEVPERLDATDAIPFERVAALDPDVIIGLYQGMTAEDYELLAAIAPTVAQPGEYSDWGIPWQEATLAVGRIVGRYEQAEALVAEVEAAFADARAAHPEFAGAAGAMATPYEGIFVYAPEDPRGRFLEALGFRMPDELTALVTDEFGFDLSYENVDLLDLDALVWLDVEDAGTDQYAGPAYEALDVHAEGRDVFLDSEAPDALGGATSFVTVLSLPFLLDGLVPMLAAAVDGDPATTVPAGEG